MALRVLYISYDGILEPLGQSQILPYLERLSAQRIEFFLLTFEKPSARTAEGDSEELRGRLRRKGISWIPVRYHKFPSLPATLYDVLVGIVVGASLVRRHKIRVVHARSYVSALIALILKRCLGTRFLFDMRGFWADERVDGGIWRTRSALYRVAKGFERAYLRTADAVVSLTCAAEAEIDSFGYLQDRRPRVEVIPTCVDLDRFRPDESSQPNPGPHRFTLVYSGSLGTWYRFDEMLAFFLVLKTRVPDALFLVLTQTPRDSVEATARKRGVDPGDISISSVPFQQMPGRLASASAGIIFSTPSWANKARCPTKLAEFLALGVPVIVNRGIGDLETIVPEERVGVVVEQFSRAAYEAALGALLDLLGDPGLRRRCRQVAERHFSLEEGVLKYRQLYDALAETA